EEEVSLSAGEERTILVSTRAVKPPPEENPRVVVAAQHEQPWRSESTSMRAPRASGGGPPLGTWVSFGVAAAAGVTAGAFGGLTVAAKGTYERGPNEDTLDTFRERR